MTIVRLGICLLVAFSVLAHGAVEPWSEAVLEVGVGVLLLLWAVRTAIDAEVKIIWNPLLWPLLGIWLIALLQLLVRTTAYPFATRIELLKFTSLVALFFLCVQAYRTLEHWHGFVWFLLILGFLVSVFAILQHFTFNGKLYWMREVHYAGIPFGPYVNRNHFAGLVELLIPPGVALLVLRSERRDQLPLVALFTLFPIGALFLSASRGGILSLFSGFVLLSLLIFFRRRENKELMAAGLLVALAIGLVSWLGVGRAIERFASYKTLEVSEGRRVGMLRGTWRIFLDHPITGTGFGTLQDVFPPYETVYDGLIVNHSHNDYVELLSDTGIFGGLCGLTFLIILAQMGLANLTAERNPLRLAFHVGALAGCFGLLVHGIVDFNFHIPSNALIFLLLAAMATSQAPSTRLQHKS